MPRTNVRPRLAAGYGRARRDHGREQVEWFALASGHHGAVRPLRVAEVPQQEQRPADGRLIQVALVERDAARALADVVPDCRCGGEGFFVRLEHQASRDFEGCRLAAFRLRAGQRTRGAMRNLSWTWVAMIHNV